MRVDSFYAVGEDDIDISPSEEDMSTGAVEPTVYLNDKEALVRLDFRHDPLRVYAPSSPSLPETMPPACCWIPLAEWKILVAAVEILIEQEITPPKAAPTSR